VAGLCVRSEEGTQASLGCARETDRRIPEEEKGEVRYVNKKGVEFSVVITIIVIFFLLCFGIYKFAYAMTSGEESITVKEKWVKYHGDDAKYLVSSTDGEVFEITDSFFRWRFDSSDLYADLEPGMTCSIQTQGWRFPFFSDYKNIIEANCSPAEERMVRVV